MSELYNKIIKERYNRYIEQNDIPASDFVKLLCETPNLSTDFKNTIKSAFDKIQQKRTEYINLTAFNDFTDYINPLITKYISSHKLHNTTIDNIIKHIWKNIPEHIKKAWSKPYFEFDSDRIYRYPYLIHLYNISADEGYLLCWDYKNMMRDDFVCFTSINKCDACMKRFQPDTNITIMMNKLLSNIKNDYDLQYITNEIIMKYNITKQILILNHIICKRFYDIIHKKVSRNDPQLLKLKSYLRFHEIIRKRVKNNKLRKFIILCNNQYFNKKYLKSLKDKWNTNKVLKKLNK
jgi:hypothetical protein